MRYDFFAGTDGSTAPCICFIDLPEHPFDVERAARGLHANVVNIPIENWDDALTPWPAPGLYKGDADFGGQAGATLSALLESMLPAIEEDRGLSPAMRGIAGYSLGGLFSLYAFASCGAFAGVAAMSSSVWYEGWPEWLAAQSIDGTGRHAFLSLGTKEKRAAPFILHTVEDRTCETADLLQTAGVDTQLSIGPGSHYQFIDERLAAGLTALDGFLHPKS